MKLHLEISSTVIESFDHHQELKYNSLNGEEVPMSSFGLVCKKSFLELGLIMFDKDLQT